MEWLERSGVRWLEADLGRGRAAFSTRLGGVSAAPFDSLNLGLLTEDGADAVAENRGRLAAALGFGVDRVAFARQVHGSALITQAGPPLHRPFASPAGGGETDAEGGEGLPVADGQVVTKPGTAGLVFVADCLPVALSGPRGVAMLHCGWRGLAGGIVAAGAQAVDATRAAIGPGIGPCCYEVGDEVLDAFARLGPGIAVDAPEGNAGGGRSAGRHLDLPELARRLLAEAGVGEVEAAGLCTRCEERLFFSHRRDAGRTGRQAGVAWLEDN